MAGIGEIAEKKVTRKRCIQNPTTALDTNSTKKRLLPLRSCRYRSSTTLLDVNDDCLLIIFGKLNEIDVCQVQNVCTRFVPLAETAFRNIRERYPDPDERNIFELNLPRSDLRRVVYKFGHLYQSCRIYGSEHIRSDIMQRLTHVTCLTLTDASMSIDGELLLAIYSAVHLKLLSINCAHFTKFLTHSSLENLKEKSSLQRLFFQDALPPLNQFIDFLRYNQQLVCLGVPANVPLDYIDQIIKHAKQISEIQFFFENKSSPHNPYFHKLVGNLKKAKRGVSFRHCKKFVSCPQSTK